MLQPQQKLLQKRVMVGISWHYDSFLFFFLLKLYKFYLLDWKSSLSELFTSLHFYHLSSPLHWNSNRTSKQTFWASISGGQKKPHTSSHSEHPLFFHLLLVTTENRSIPPPLPRYVLRSEIPHLIAMSRESCHMPKSTVERNGFSLCWAFLVSGRIGRKGSKANRISMNLKVEITRSTGWTSLLLEFSSSSSLFQL